MTTVPQTTTRYLQPGWFTRNVSTEGCAGLPGWASACSDHASCGSRDHQVQPFSAVEMADSERPEILGEYLRPWKAEVGVFFEGISQDASDEQLFAIAPGYPVFTIHPRG